MAKYYLQCHNCNGTAQIGEYTCPTCNGTRVILRSHKLGKPVEILVKFRTNGSQSTVTLWGFTKQENALLAVKEYVASRKWPARVMLA